MQLWPHMLSVGAICFKDRFCASEQGGIGGGGWAKSRHDMHMVAVLVGLYKGFGGLFLSFSAQMGIETAPLPLVGAPFLAL